MFSFAKLQGATSHCLLQTNAEQIQSQNANRKAHPALGCYPALCLCHPTFSPITLGLMCRLLSATTESKTLRVDPTRLNHIRSSVAQRQSHSRTATTFQEWGRGARLSARPLCLHSRRGAAAPGAELSTTDSAPREPRRPAGRDTRGRRGRRGAAASRVLTHTRTQTHTHTCTRTPRRRGHSPHPPQDAPPPPPPPPAARGAADAPRSAVAVAPGGRGSMRRAAAAARLPPAAPRKPPPPRTAGAGGRGAAAAWCCPPPPPRPPPAPRSPHRPPHPRGCAPPGGRGCWQGGGGSPGAPGPLRL